jgi:ABC-type lipoprotein export system ATPase subunit
MEVQTGEMIAIMGASGSGKSTLMNILSGLDRPSAGQVTVGNKDLLNISDEELVLYRRLEVGFVWQATARNLVPYLNVIENIEMPQAISGESRKTRTKRSIDLLTILGMEGKAKRHIWELSGGEQQRLAIAVGMANQPPLLLADEPTGELDNQTAAQVFNLLREMNQNYQVTIIVVTHDTGVTQYMDRVLQIRDGRISSVNQISRNGNQTSEEEFLVVDKVGRLQIPQEYLDKLNFEGLAKIDLEDNHMNIKPR